MKKYNEIREQIRPALEEVEAFRIEKQAAAKKGGLSYILPIIIIAMSVVGLLATEEAGFAVFGIIGGIIAWALVESYFVRVHIKEYESRFKTEVFNTFIGHLYPEASYEPTSFITEEKFDASKLFGGHNRYSGEDYFTGKTEGGNHFEFSELRAYYRSGGKNNTTTTIFSGLFFILETDGEMSGEVFVKPDYAEKKMGAFGKMLQKNLGSLFSDAKLVYMKEHPEFEKEFVVTAPKESDAYRVLSPAMIDALYNIKYQWNKPLHVSFVNNKIYIGLWSEENYFHPNIKKSVTEDLLLEELYEELSSCLAVLEDLSEIEKLPMDYDPSRNWVNSAYDHLLDHNN